MSGLRLDLTCTFLSTVHFGFKPQPFQEGMQIIELPEQELILGHLIVTRFYMFLRPKPDPTDMIEEVNPFQTKSCKDFTFLWHILPPSLPPAMCCACLHDMTKVLCC